VISRSILLSLCCYNGGKCFGQSFLKFPGSTDSRECGQHIVKQYSSIQKQGWKKYQKEPTKRRPGGPKVTNLVTVWDHFCKQVDEKARKGTFQKSMLLWTRTKCLSRGYDTFRVPPGCQATPARWSHLERKTKGREQKAEHLGPHLEPKGSTSKFREGNYL
jgi:hypothetical protein